MSERRGIPVGEGRRLPAWAPAAAIFIGGSLLTILTGNPVPFQLSLWALFVLVMGALVSSARSGCARVRALPREIWRRVGIAVAGLVASTLACSFAYWIWPTPYHYFTLGEGRLPTRVHRVTECVQVLTLDGWTNPRCPEGGRAYPSSVPEPPPQTLGDFLLEKGSLRPWPEIKAEMQRKGLSAQTQYDVEREYKRRGGNP